MSLFPKTKNELIYISLIVVFVALFFWIEYEWIIRPDQFLRRDISMRTGKRPSYYNDAIPDRISLDITNTSDRKKARNTVQEYIECHAKTRERCRNYEELTFIGYVNRFRLSSIIVTINLGFEELEHRGVIHGMLLGVREQYHRQFVSLRSARVLMRTIFSLFLAMILVSDLSANRFNIEEKIINSAVKNKPDYFDQLTDVKLEKYTIVDRINEHKKVVIENK